MTRFTFISFFQKFVRGQAWWLKPLTQLLWEAEIRRIEVQSQPREIVHETLS
jgi:hypothetical protein